MEKINFWEYYECLENENEQQSFLKDYLFSLPPQEMCEWILSEAKTIFDTLKTDLSDPLVSDEWKTTIREKLSEATLNLEELRGHMSLAKAA